MSHGIGMSLLPIIWSCGPAQVAAIFAVPYNLVYIAQRKIALAQEQAKLNPSVEKINRLRLEIYSAWKAIKFYKDTSRPVLGSQWEIDAYREKKEKQDELFKLLSENVETTANSILAENSDVESRLRNLFSASFPLDYNPDFKKFNEVRNRAFGLIQELRSRAINQADFMEKWPQVKRELQALDLS